MVTILLILILIFARSTTANSVWKIIAPLNIIGGRVVQGMHYMLSPFASKVELQNENAVLRALNAQLRADALDRTLLAEKNIELKAALGRPNTAVRKILAEVLARPPQLPYDVIILNVGSTHGAELGHMVGSGAAAFGIITDVSADSSKATLFTSSGKETNALLKGKVPLTLMGMGGGAFTAQVPQATEIAPGDLIELPGGTGSVVAIVQNIVAETGKSFENIYLAAPVSFFSLPTLEVWLTQLPDTKFSTTTEE